MIVYLNGLILGLSLIMALGPQNIFLIRQGARQNHAVLSVLICFCCDAILATASIIGLHQLIELHPLLKNWMTWLGAGFLALYGVSALKNALLQTTSSEEKRLCSHSRWQIILLAMGFSLLNPQAIIDTLIIIGSGSSQFHHHEMAFLLGVLTASFLWFSSLTLTTRYYSTILSQTMIWQKIEFVSGLLMIGMGIKLVLP
ncbi:amino acid transporter [Legionella israelensis]|uniref:Amino acid transporter n=1 Tax=Legionella israelensis TaxID=454 RepID=A0AAX1EDL9_9GAMM|nr:LysE family transporter [Legionella israelensis]QBR83159.1 amino acid transporter [Legionella israelensis]